MKSFLICLLFASSAHAYVFSSTQDGKPIHWTEREVPWYLNKSGSEDVPFRSVEAAAIASFKTWEDVSCSDLTFPYKGVTESDEIGYVIGGNNQNIVRFTPADEWLHGRGVIGLTTVTFCTERSGFICPYVGRVLDTDMELNEEFYFTVQDLPQYTYFDIQNTITHEAGHVLGLDHTPVQEATMYVSAPEGEITKRTLAQDDIDGLCALYPIGEKSPGTIEYRMYEGDDCTQSSGSNRSGIPFIFSLFGLFGLFRISRRRAN